MEMKKVSSCFSTFILLLLSFTSFVSSQSDSCSSKLTVSNLIPFNTSSLTCMSAWSSEGFILRYENAGPSLWNFVLSAPDKGAYIAIGFSGNGRMVGSSAMVGWKSSSGVGIVKQYYLGGYSSDQCPPDKGSLSLVQGSSLIVSQSSRLYLAFQLSTAQPQSSLVYAVGPSNSLPSSGGYLSTHRDMASGTLSTPAGGGGGGDDDGDDDEHGRNGDGEGESSSERKRGGDDDSDGKDAVARRSGGGLSLAKKHALLTILGWGILLPIGAATARFLKHHDQFWFYSHVLVQGVAFVVGVIGVLAGFKLEHNLGDGRDVDAHKTLGIFVLAFGSLQVMAVLMRPKKEAKARKYWNWYHHNVGRAAIVCAVANIFYGLRLAKEARDWSYGYGIFVGVWVVVCFVLEEWRRKHVAECSVC
ncbi:hypothetical protein C4D60_Mb02t02690 [Musa balbisiana]|uniref:Cytochrome b561 and DOMON domain-containing protein n=1 Tax=Musa balbisiana TaxID=52838 RepID=A0A4S8I7S3_MUSBA|nr:hypothetical protein C4D60_Mb02t02690 [Musa balbisiana]